MTRPAPARSLAALAALLALAAAACGGASVQPSGTPTVTVDLAAKDSVFDQQSLSVPTGGPFAINFHNQDAVPHNVSVQGGPGPMTGELFGGPASRVYVFAELPAGTYTFLCDLHPEMRGTLEVTPGSSG